MSESDKDRVLNYDISHLQDVRDTIDHLIAELDKGSSSTSIVTEQYVIEEGDQDEGSANAMGGSPSDGASHSCAGAIGGRVEA